MQAPQKSTLIGQHVGRYRVSRLIGQGGMGTVYEVVQDTIGHRAAMKVLSGQISMDANHNTYMSRFLDEARAVNLINHAGVVQIFDFGDLPDKSFYILMEYLDGSSLSEYLTDALAGKRARMTIAQTMELARQIASVMARAHEVGIVHRDLKPDNLFIVKDASLHDGVRAKVLDFGLAKFLDSPERRTAAGLALGTPMYMSPEQCYGADKLDGQSDVYSLGAVFYEVFSGQTPFLGEPGKVMRKHVSEAHTPLQDRVPNIGDAVAALINDMLHKDPGKRPTMTEVEARIARMEERGELLKQPPILAGQTAPAGAENYAPTVAVATAPRAPQKSAGSSRKLGTLLRRPPVLMLGGGLLLIGLLVGTFVGSRLGRASQPPPVASPPLPAECPPPPKESPAKSPDEKPAAEEGAPKPAKTGEGAGDAARPVVKKKAGKGAAAVEKKAKRPK